MPVKVIMTWDIAADHEQEYFEFVIGEWVPGVQRLGFQPVDAWATVYGTYPQIQVGLLADSSPARPRTHGLQRLGCPGRPPSDIREELHVQGRLSSERLPVLANHRRP